MSLLLPSNPLTTTFPGSTLPTGMSQYPTSLLTNSHVTVVSNTLRIGFDPGVADMLLTTNAPRVLLPVSDSDDYNFYMVFKMTVTFTAGVSGRAACGVALCTGDGASDWFTAHELAGTTAGVPVYSAVDSNTVGAASGTQNTLQSLARWVRIVAIDNVVYAEQASGASSTAPTTGWTRFDNSSVVGSITRLSQGHGKLMFFARGADATTDNAGVDMVVSQLSVTSWARYVEGAQVSSLLARPWLEGKRVDLSWTNPTNQDTPRWICIMRSTMGHPEFMPGLTLTTLSEGLGLSGVGEIVYEGVPVESFTDTDVREDLFYYYSVFLSRAPQADLFTTQAGTLAAYANRPSSTDWGPQIPPTNKVTGLSITARYEHHGNWFYEQFPVAYVEADQQDAADLGSSTGYLERYSRFLGAGIDFMHGHVKAFRHLSDGEKTPLGLVGKAADQTSIVDNFLRDYDFPVAGLSAASRRRLFLYGVKHLKLKGSVAGCCSFIRLITGWTDDVCVEPGIGLNLRWLRTWDGCTTRDDFSVTNSVVAAGSVSGLSGLAPNKYKGGLYVDWFGNTAQIADNDATSITFSDSSFTPRKEMSFTGDVSMTGVTITALGTGARLPGDDSFNGGQVMSSGGSAIGDITDTVYAALSASEQVAATGLTTGMAQTVVVARAYSGASYAARVATHNFWLFTGEPSWLYHGGSDLSLVGAATDPFYRLWPGLNPVGSGSSYPMTDYDFLVYAPVGAAKAANRAVSSVTSSTVVLPTTGTTVLVGDWMNPNRNQDQWFRITAISGSGPYTFTLAPNGDITPDQVCAATDLATIAVRQTVENDRNLRALMPLMLPFDSRLFVYYQE